MNTRRCRRSIVTLFMLLLGQPIAAQMGTLHLPTTDPRSVLRITGSHLVIGDQVDGQQHFVDVSTPTAPVLTSTWNAPFGDQWYEAEFTADFGGRLFTGHRAGGLNMIDVADPLAPAVAASVPTIYHYRGLKYRNAGARSFLYYAEHHHGLAVYDVGANSLTEIWRDFNNPSVDANGMELLGDHLYVFGTPFTDRGTRELRTYDVRNPATPQLVDLNTQWSVRNAVDYGHCQLRRIGIGGGMLAARQRDGLELIDASNPALPVVRQIIAPDAQINCWGTFSFPDSPLAIVYGYLGAGPATTGWWFLVVVTPNFVAPLAGGPSPMLIRDIAVDPATGRMFVVGIDNATSARRGILLVY